MPKKLRLVVVLLLLAGCTTIPTGPSMLVLPGTGKSFDQFQADDAVCRQFAYQQVGGMTPERATIDSGVRSAAVGTAIGAAAGAAIDGGHGAATGAGAGLLMGGLAGTGAAETSGYGAQRRYDFGYQQCMYAKGHRIPVSGRFMTEPRQPSYPQSSSRPPPPPGTAPPPPPGVSPR